jgi:protein-S-isoprenylcysteine O-methyltransferase Ste14
MDFVDEGIMTLIPAFEIGIWNLWIFWVAWVFFHVVPLDWPIFRYDYKAQFKKSAAYPPPNKSEKIMNNFGTAILIILIIYSIFLPLPLGTPLLYAGIALFVVGLIICVIARIPWRTTPIDEPITKGLYRYSRHPIYIGVFVQYIGIGIASASWLFLLLIIVSMILSILCTPAEERFCLEKYGDTYLKYMNKTPRWIGMPKSG